MERGNDWSERLTTEVGKRVAKYRDDAGMTTAALSARCERRGLKLDRNVITKLERGFRQSVTLDELMVLAAALGVPPVQLAFGVDSGEPSEVLPGEMAGPLTALHWFSGMTELDRDAAGFAPVRPQSIRDATSARLLDQHEAAVRGLRESVTRLSKDAGMKMVASYLGQLEDGLREMRAEMRHRDMALPPLDSDLEYIDAAGAAH